LDDPEVCFIIQPCIFSSFSAGFAGNMAARAKQGAANALKAPGPTSQVDYHMSCAEDRFEHYQKQLFFIFFPELFAEEFMLVA